MRYESRPAKRLNVNNCDSNSFVRGLEVHEADREVEKRDDSSG
jgi:hypothetical protein